jgi:nicotinamide mononucleotide adenylyltransferase
VEPKPVLKKPLETAIDTIKAMFDPEEVRTRLRTIMTYTESKESIYIHAISNMIQKIDETTDCSTSIKDLAKKYESVYKESLVYKVIGSARLVTVRRRKSRRTDIRRRRQTRRYRRYQ